MLQIGSDVSTSLSVFGFSDSEGRRMYKEQNENYKVIDLRYQYTEVLGRVRYAIVSDEMEEMVSEKYGAVLRRYEPYVVISTAMSLAMLESCRNDDRHNKNAIRKHDPYSYQTARRKSIRAGEFCR
jgi:hypothetical protein